MFKYGSMKRILALLLVIESEIKQILKIFFLRKCLYFFDCMNSKLIFVNNPDHSLITYSDRNKQMLSIIDRQWLLNVEVDWQERFDRVAHSNTMDYRSKYHLGIEKRSSGKDIIDREHRPLLRSRRR